MKILAIRFARLGDIVLLLPALSSLKSRFPSAHLTFLTDRRYASLPELCPAIDQVIGVDRIAMRDRSPLRALGNMTRLVRDLRRQRYDLLIDFHSFRETNILAWFSGAQRRLAMKRHNGSYLPFCFNLPPVLEDKQLHVSEMFMRVVQRLGGSSVHSPSLVVPDGLRQWAELRAPQGRRLALYIDAPVTDRIWPPEKFAMLADHAISRFGANVLVISGPAGQDLARKVQHASQNSERLTVITNVTIPELAAVVASARLFVSNDTGPMHLGPALSVPTLGLFSVGFPEHFQPIGPAGRFLRANPIQAIEVGTVAAVAGEMWANADRDLLR